MRYWRSFHALTVVACLTSVGCATHGDRQEAHARYDEQVWMLGPLVDDQGEARSLTFDSPQMQQLQEMQPWLTAEDAWYHGRLDKRSGVIAGTRGRVLEVTQIRSRDRITSSDGDVKDNYSQSTSRYRYFESVR